MSSTSAVTPIGPRYANTSSISTSSGSSPQNRHWLIVNPQINLDQENDLNIYIVDVEFGYTIPQLPGTSIHVRPGAGIGGDRPFDFTFEFGIRFIWR